MSPDTAALLEARVTVPEHVVHRTFAAETVVLNLQTGKYHGLNTMAGQMLDILSGGATVREAAAQIATEYGVPAEVVQADLVDFCRDLVARELIELG